MPQPTTPIVFTHLALRYENSPFSAPTAEGEQVECQTARRKSLYWRPFEGQPRFIGRLQTSDARHFKFDPKTKWGNTFCPIQIPAKPLDTGLHRKQIIVYGPILNCGLLLVIDRGAFVFLLNRKRFEGASPSSWLLAQIADPEP
jgi:hypothetical protein